MKYFAALLLLLSLSAPVLMAIPPAPNIPFMSVQEMSNGTVITNLADDDPYEYGRIFKHTQIGQIANWLHIRITNQVGTFGGGADLNLTTPTVTAGGANYTLAVGGFSTTLTQGSYTEFWIGFQPQSTGTFPGEVTFTYEADPNGNPGIYTPFRINAIGEGVNTPLPVCHVEEEFLTPGPDVYHLAPAVGRRQFGKRKVSAGATPEVMYTIFNAGDAGAADLHIGTPHWVSGGGNFTLNYAGFNGTQPPNYGTSFRVAFDPNTTGQHTAILEFTQDDGYFASPFQIIFEGEGIAESSQIRVGDSAGPYFDTNTQPAQYIGTHLNEYEAPSGPRDFGSVNSGQTVSLTITVANADVGYLDPFGLVPGTDLTLGTPTVVGPSDFTLDLNGFSNTVTSAGTTTFVVRFSPLANGARTAVIEIPHGDTSERAPFRVIVTGTGMNVGGTGTGGGSGGGGGCSAVESGPQYWTLLAVLGGLLMAVRMRRRA